MRDSRPNDHRRHKDRKPSSILTWCATGTPAGFVGSSYYSERLGLDHGDAHASWARTPRHNKTARGNARTQRDCDKSRSVHDAHQRNKYHNYRHQAHEDMEAKPHRTQHHHPRESRAYAPNRGTNEAPSTKSHLSYGPKPVIPNVRAAHIQSTFFYPSDIEKGGQDAMIISGEGSQYHSMQTSPGPMPPPYMNSVGQGKY